MKFQVVPLPSERWTVVIVVSGRLTPLFSLTIAGSFHFVISPEKIFASVGPSMCSRFLTLETL